MSKHEDAKFLLENKALKFFFEESRKDQHRIIEKSSYNQEDERFEAYLKLNALSDLENTLEYFATTGEMKEFKTVKRLKSLD